MAWALTAALGLHLGLLLVVDEVAWRFDFSRVGSPGSTPIRVTLVGLSTQSERQAPGEVQSIDRVATVSDSPGLLTKFRSLSDVVLVQPDGLVNEPQAVATLDDRIVHSRTFEESSDEDYRSFERLTTPPTVLSEIVLPTLNLESMAGPLRAVVTLFIDETGQVVHAEVDGSNLPFEVEEATRTAFGHAQFRPGMADGRAVKARMRVELVYDVKPPVWAHPRRMGVQQSPSAPSR